MKLREGYKQFLKCRQVYTKAQHNKYPLQACTNGRITLPIPEYNADYLCNPLNRDAIFNNIQKRKGIGDIDKVLQLSKRPEDYQQLQSELAKIPNCTHPKVLEYGDEPFLLKECGQKREFDFVPQEFSELCKHLKLLRTDSLGPVSGQKSYMFHGELSDLEQALVNYTIKKVMQHGFNIVSVPDIIPTSVIDRCGLIAESGRTLVYTLDDHYDEDLSLAGTAEMSLAAMLTNKEFSFEELPLKLVAVSRCFRAERAKISQERGIYRVHQFTKVEMFICSEQENSEEQFKLLQSIQEELFSSLGLHFQIIDMPPHDLGAPAYRKTDMEGWMPGRKQYGELSSCSNCTDFQSRRLNIKYRTKDGQLLHVHTLNGTACAVPRMLIALCETFQTKHGRIDVPDVLLRYMKNRRITTQRMPEMRPFKYKPSIIV